jgi:hypothetical protein
MTIKIRGCTDRRAQEDNVDKRNGIAGIGIGYFTSDYGFLRVRRLLQQRKQAQTDNHMQREDFRDIVTHVNQFTATKIVKI